MMGGDQGRRKDGRVFAPPSRGAPAQERVEDEAGQGPHGEV